MAPEFDTFDELWLGALQGVIDSPVEDKSRDGGVVGETLGYVGRLNDPTSNMLLNPVRKWSPHYAAAEVLWYLSGEASIDRILPYAPQYKRFANELSVSVDSEGREVSPDSPNKAGTDKRLACPGAAYGCRWRQSIDKGADTQITALIKMLQNTPNSRQLVLSMWDASFDLLHAKNGTLNSVPCTLSLQFIVRDGKLNMSAFMRSCDVWLGLPYDLFAFTCLQQMVAEIVKIPVGWYQHHVTTLHLYERNALKAHKAINPPSFDVPHKPHEWGRMHGAHPAYIMETIAKAIGLEQHNRRIRGVATAVDQLGLHSLLHELVVMAALKWASPKERYIKMLKHPLLRKYCEKFYASEAS